MTAYLDIGNTWDRELIKGIAKLNRTEGKRKDKKCVRVDTLYGCTAINLLGNARSPDRLQQLDLEETKAIIDLAHSHELRIAWTINESCVGNVKEFCTNFKNNASALQAFFEYLDVDVLIVAHPLTMLLLAEHGIDIPITISTITAISEPAQITELIDLGCNITNICVPIVRNRDLTYLTSLSKTCKLLGVEIELIVNEFCFLNACNCEGLLRRSCYDMNAHAKMDDGQLDFPRGICVREREKDPANWLRAKWILPQHMQLYELLGIHRFKITGRTHPTQFLLNILPYYMDRYFGGNLLELWPHLQTIGAKDFREEQDRATKELFIDASKLGKFFAEVLSKCINDCSMCSICKQTYNQLCI